MFRCAAAGYVSALYEAAGLHDIAEWDVEVELVTRSPVEYWEMISEHVSLAVSALQQVDEPARERIAKAVIAEVSTYEKDGKVRVPGLARCIIGTKQGRPKSPREAPRPSRNFDDGAFPRDGRVVVGESTFQSLELERNRGRIRVRFQQRPA